MYYEKPAVNKKTALKIAKTQNLDESLVLNKGCGSKRRREVESKLLKNYFSHIGNNFFQREEPLSQ